MSSCGAVVGGVSLEHIDVSRQAVIQGVVSNADGPTPIGYVRLHDHNDEFVAEVPVSRVGEFRFFAAPGEWNLVALIPGGKARVKVNASLGNISDVDVLVS
ncbi:MAG: DUF1416 domain-containing protein [Actinomycetes bacterium]